MIVDQVRHRCGDQTCELSASVRSEAWGRERFTLWYRIPSAMAPQHSSEEVDCSPFLAGLLLWCLRRSEPLRIDGAVSRRLLDSVPLAIDVCRAFWPDEMSPVEVVAERREPVPAAVTVASLFTRGVDSWYTALTHGQRPYDVGALTHLVYVPSVDFMYDEDGLARSVEATAAAAAEAGMTLTVADTNLRRHTEPFLHWGYYYGLGLASVGLALGVRRLLMPAPRSYGYLEPEGSHPLLDRLWSTARTEVVHHGAEATRWDKILFLAGFPAALRSLKVCFAANTDGNCGRCDKCLVTMVMLQAVGVLDQCSFDAPLDPVRVARLDLPPSGFALLRERVLPAVTERRLALALQALALRPSARDLARDARGALGTVTAAAADRARAAATRVRRAARDRRGDAAS